MAAGLFEFVSREYIADVLETLHKYTQLPLQLLDARGEKLLSYGERTRYCALLQENVFTPQACEDLHRKAGARAQA